jgi:hypothetical protein
MTASLEPGSNSSIARPDAEQSLRIVQHFSKERSVLRVCGRPDAQVSTGMLNAKSSGISGRGDMRHP